VFTPEQLADLWGQYRAMMAESPAEVVPEVGICYVCFDEFEKDSDIFTPPCHKTHQLHAVCYRQILAAQPVPFCGLCRALLPK